MQHVRLAGVTAIVLDGKATRDEIFADLTDRVAALTACITGFELSSDLKTHIALLRSFAGIPTIDGSPWPSSLWHDAQTAVSCCAS